MVDVIDLTSETVEPDFIDLTVSDDDDTAILESSDPP
jgi:hypothetical protein